MLSFDELNALSQRNVIDIDRYFDEMELPETEKEDRKEFAKRFQRDVYAALSLIYLALAFRMENIIDVARRNIRDSFLDAIREYTVPDSFLEKYADTLADEIVDATVRNQGGLFNQGTTEATDEDRKWAYFFSDDRATFIAEDQTNAVFNYEQYRDAKSRGLMFKQWITMHDENVRRTHAEIHGVIVRIDDFFEVGDCMMRYPKDVMYGTPEETVNCRCVCRYLTEEDFLDILRAA